MNSFSYFLTSTFEYNIHGLFCILCGVLSGGNGLFIWSRDFSSTNNRNFFFITFFGSLWIILHGLQLIVESTHHAIILLGTSYLTSVPYISPAVYHFVSRWTRFCESKLLSYAGFISAFLLGIPIFLYRNPIFEFRPISWGRYDLLIPSLWGYALIITHLIIFTIYALLSLFIAIYSWRKSTLKLQRKNFGIF